MKNKTQTRRENSGPLRSTQSPKRPQRKAAGPMRAGTNARQVHPLSEQRSANSYEELRRILRTNDKARALLELHVAQHPDRFTPGGLAALRSIYLGDPVAVQNTKNQTAGTNSRRPRTTQPNSAPGAPLPDQECEDLYILVDSAGGEVALESVFGELEGALEIAREHPGMEQEAQAIGLMLEGARMLCEGRAYQHGKLVCEARLQRQDSAEKAAENDLEFSLPLPFRHAFLAAYGRAEGLPFKQAVGALQQLSDLACLSEGLETWRDAINNLKGGVSWLGRLAGKMQASVQPGADETRITFNRGARSQLCAVLGLPPDADVQAMSRKLDEAKPAAAPERAAA